MYNQILLGSDSWGSRLHQLHHCRGASLSQRVTSYDTKQSNGETPIMHKVWKTWSTTSLLLLPDSPWPRVIAVVRVLSIGQIELFDI